MPGLFVKLISSTPPLRISKRLEFTALPLPLSVMPPALIPATPLGTPNATGMSMTVGPL